MWRKSSVYCFPFISLAIYPLPTLTQITSLVYHLLPSLLLIFPSVQVFLGISVLFMKSSCKVLFFVSLFLNFFYIRMAAWPHPLPLPIFPLSSQSCLIMRFSLISIPLFWPLRSLSNICNIPLALELFLSITFGLFCHFLPQ